MPPRADTPAPLGTHLLVRAVVSAVPNIIDLDFLHTQSGAVTTIRLTLFGAGDLKSRLGPLTSIHLSDPTTTEHHG